MTISTTMCSYCVHASLADDGSVATCDAFPKGIPEPILRGKVEHTEPFPGDHGILFKSVDSSTDGGAGSDTLTSVSSPPQATPPSTY